MVSGFFFALSWAILHRRYQRFCNLDEFVNIHIGKHFNFGVANHESQFGNIGVIEGNEVVGGTLTNGNGLRSSISLIGDNATPVSCAFWCFLVSSRRCNGSEYAFWFFPVGPRESLVQYSWMPINHGGLSLRQAF